MTTYNTRNPVGSVDVKDLYDNAQNLDHLVNDRTVTQYADRLGQPRKSWYGMEQDFNAVLANSQFEYPPLPYAAGLVIQRPTQLIDRAGQLYRVLLPASFPLTLSGTWATDAPLLTAMSDAVLRKDLANEASVSLGTAIVGRSVQIVSTVANLRTLLKTSVSKFAYTLGYYAAGDFGGGWYWLDLADSTTPDNGGSVIVGSDGGRWKLASNQPVTLRQFGAVGDGTADDTAAFQAAASFVLTKRAAVLGLTGGQFRITAAINFALTGQQSLCLYGTSIETTEIIVDYAGHNGLNISSPSGNWWLNIDPHNAVTLRDFSVLATRGGNVGTGIKLSLGQLTGRPSPKSSFNNVGFRAKDGFSQFFAVNVDLVSSGNIWFDSCTWRIGGPAIVQGIGIRMSASDSSHQCSGWFVNNCEFIYGETGIILGDYCEGLYVTATPFINCKSGIYWNAPTAGESGLLVTNCEFDTIVFGIVGIGVFDAAITGNCFLMEDPSAVAGISLLGGNGITISGNKISGPGSAGTAIILNGLANNAGRRTTIGNNSINNWENGVTFAGTVNNVDLPDNNGFGLVTNRIVYTGSRVNCRIEPRTYRTQPAVSFGSAAASQTLTIAIPSGVFAAAPAIGIAQAASGGTSKQMINFNYGMGSATSVSFTVTNADGTNVGTGPFRYMVYLSEIENP